MQGDMSKHLMRSFTSAHRVGAKMSGKTVTGPGTLLLGSVHQAGIGIAAGRGTDWQSIQL